MHTYGLKDLYLQTPVLTKLHTELSFLHYCVGMDKNTFMSKF